MAKQNKMDWVTHYVFETDKEDFNGLANIHTHGLVERYNHPDFQVVLPILPEVISGVFHGIVEQIKKGKRFEKNEWYSNVIQNFKVNFIEYTETDRTVLRLILPDPNGRFPGEIGCESPYDRQLEVLPEEGKTNEGENENE